VHPLSRRDGSANSIAWIDACAVCWVLVVHRRGRRICPVNLTVPEAHATASVLTELESSLLNARVLEAAVERAVAILCQPDNDGRALRHELMRSSKKFDVIPRRSRRAAMSRSWWHNCAPQTTSGATRWSPPGRRRRRPRAGSESGADRSTRATLRLALDPLRRPSEGPRPRAPVGCRQTRARGGRRATRIQVHGDRNAGAAARRFNSGGGDGAVTEWIVPSGNRAHLAIGISPVFTGSVESASAASRPW
jgi:hypothetical protein